MVQVNIVRQIVITTFSPSSLAETCGDIHNGAIVIAGPSTIVALSVKVPQSCRLSVHS